MKPGIFEVQRRENMADSDPRLILSHDERIIYYETLCQRRKSDLRNPQPGRELVERLHFTDESLF